MKPAAPARPAPRSNDLTSLLLVFPLFLVYQVGVLGVPSSYNGADLVTSLLLKLLRGNLGAYLALAAGLTVAFVVAVAVLRKKNEFSPNKFIPVLIESGLYAVTMGALIVLVMTKVLHIDPSLSIHPAAAAAQGPAELGLLGKIVLSCGAGVHEELLFRLVLVPLLVALFAKAFGLHRALSIVLAFFAAALLFSAAHHVIGGEPWKIGVFVYRTLCGLIFATIFWFRGFAVDVYTHALYDVFVLVLH